MTHPSYRPAVISQDVAATATSGRYYAPAGSSERYPPIVVHTPDEEESERARGYLNPNEPPPVAHHAEYPKMLRHPEHRDAIPASQEALVQNGGVKWVAVPGTPEHLPDVLVETPEAEQEWRAKGYGPAGHWDEGAFERATSAPIPEGYDPAEWPKWMDGPNVDKDGNPIKILVQDPNAIPPEVLERQKREYPKWVGGEKGRVVNTPDEEREVLNGAASVLEATAPTPTAPTHRAYVAPAPPQGILDAAALKREIVDELSPMLKDMIREALSPALTPLVVPPALAEDMRAAGMSTENIVVNKPLKLGRKPMSQATKDAMAAGRRRRAAERRAQNAGVEKGED